MTIENVFSRSFNIRGGVYTPHLPVNSLNLGGYNTSLIVDCTSNNIDIPIILKSAIVREELLANPCVYSKGIYSETSNIQIRTALKIFEQMRTVTPEYRIRKVVTSSTTYYVGTGLILNCEFKPLLMLSLSADVQEGAFTKVNCKVHPRVFAKPKDLVNKTIIKKAIPYYMTNTVNIESTASFHSDYLEGKVRIIIEDFDDMFVTPNTPSMDNFEESIHQCLIDNIEDIT